MDVEKGRENCRRYVEERKLIRVAKEAGLTTDQVVEGIATGQLGGNNTDDAKVAEGITKDHDE